MAGTANAESQAMKLWADRSAGWVTHRAQEATRSTCLKRRLTAGTERCLSIGYCTICCAGCSYHHGVKLYKAYTWQLSAESFGSVCSMHAMFGKKPPVVLCCRRCEACNQPSSFHDCAASAMFNKQWNT